MKLVAQPAAAFDPVLERLREDSARHFSSPSVTLERGRHVVRPFSQVLEITVRAEGRAVTAFVKILKPRLAGARELEATRRNVTREFEATARLHAGFAPHPGLSTARPIACYPELLAVVTERIEGDTLDRLLAREARAAPSARRVERLAGIMRLVGAWLRTFQTLDGAEGRVSLDRLREYLDDRLRPLAASGALSGPVRAGLLRYFDRRARDVLEDQLAAVPVHADFAPENLIIRDGTVSVLDFTMAKRGARYLDLAHMFMQIELLKAKPWFRPAVIDRLTAAMLAGFDPALRSDRPLFELLLLQHVVCRLRQNDIEALGLPERLFASYVRRRHLKWLAARADPA
jgi:aminoglycoside phosphotransferase (APT) family kinase protein